MADFTKKQKEAIETMNRALKLCRRSGILIFGMDEKLFYTSRQAVEFIENKYGDQDENGRYNFAAETYIKIQEEDNDHRFGKFNTEKVFVDSAGW